jgi:hypothetical protein
MRNDRDMLYNAPATNGFAAQRDYRPAEKPKQPSMLRGALVAGGIAVAVLAAMSLWSWSAHKRGGVPVVEADNRPVREKPIDQGGMKIDGANEAILSGNTDGKAVVAAAPESPALAALRSGSVVSATPAPAPAPAAPSKVQVNMFAGNGEGPLLNASPPPVVAPPSAANSLPPAPASAVAHPAAKPSVPTGPGAAVVQLAALKSQAAATTEWDRLVKKYPALLGGREPNIVSAAHDGKSFWRLRVGGFADKKGAGEFCNKLKAVGAQCTLSAG